ncbi:unnamed protein product [Brassica oleracea var. botrytis]
MVLFPEALNQLIMVSLNHKISFLLPISTAVSCYDAALHSPIQHNRQYQSFMKGN